MVENRKLLIDLQLLSVKNKNCVVTLDKKEKPQNQASI